MYLVYTMLAYAALPFALLRLLWRSRSVPAYRERWSERLGRVTGGPLPGGIWIHAVSVGEVQAVAPLVRLLLERHPDKAVTITTTTVTGSDQVRRLFGDQVFHTYMPYDLPRFLHRFLDVIQPTLFLMVETEVWPNLLRACQERGIKTLLANARLSERSQRGYLRLGGFTHRVFGSIDEVAAQTEDDARRFRLLGARRVSLTGSIKFDMSMPASVTEQVEVMRRNLEGRPVWMAASTHEGEDEIMLVAHARLLSVLPEALLILVPRHPERFDRVASQVVRAGHSLVRRSRGDFPKGDTQVYLGDTMGELPVLLGASDVAFMGGSLVRVGGHNMLEAAAQGVPVCFGPHTFNFALIGRMLVECGAAQVVNDAEQLAGLLRAWLANASQRAVAGEAGRQVVERNRGALDRLYERVDSYLK